MSLSTRVAKLERDRVLHPATLMDRYWAHVDNVSLRLSGKPLRQTDVSRERIFEEMGDEFQRSLSIEELTQFLAELKRARAEIATDIH
jgi:hypothetical protein